MLTLRSSHWFRWRVEIQRFAARLTRVMRCGLNISSREAAMPDNAPTSRKMASDCPKIILTGFAITMPDWLNSVLAIVCSEPHIRLDRLEHDAGQFGGGIPPRRPA